MRIFGLSPLEAMASGETGGIAVDEGGFAKRLRPGPEFCRAITG